MSLSVNIEKKLGSFTLRVGFEAEDTVTALFGASGCGKSVTLKCIAGVMTPDRGTITLNGKTLFDSERRIALPPQERHVGYLFQQYALFPNMTAEQNIRCAIRCGSREEKRRKTAEAVERFRLRGLEKLYPSQLSGGQQQRIALVRILLSEPETILLDEPFSALDSFLKWELESELTEILADFGGSVLWVSHDPTECSRNCKNVCVMENGRVIRSTSMALLRQKPTTLSEARLLGYRSILRISRNGGRLFFSDWQISLPCSESVTQAEYAVIPESAVRIGEGTVFHIIRTIPDIDGSILLLRPSAAPQNAPCISLRFSQQINEQTVRLTIIPERLLLF